jgi:hypothetical protein
MGCKQNIDELDDSLDPICNDKHCYNYTAPKPPSIGTGTGVTFSFIEYPPATIRDPNLKHSYNIPKRDSNAVMYNSTKTAYDPSLGAPPAICGMATKADGCTTLFGRDNFSTSVLAFDYTPNKLSFDFQYSDAWFSYLYDTASEAGHIGIAAYHLETRNRTTTNTTAGTPASGTEGQPGYNAGTPGTSTSTTSDGVRCIPCTNFTCTPASTTLSYSGVEDLTDDPDCPHPALFAISSESYKIAFSYDELSTQVPNGVLGFEVSYDGVTYTNAWDTGELTGIEYVTSQNPWSIDDAGFSDFEIFDINDGVNAVDLRVKFRIESILDDTVTPAVITGTRWIATEIVSNGTGFSVGQVFPLESLVRLADNSIVTMTLNLKITSIGPIESLSSADFADILRTDDRINGHRILRAFHTEVGEFPYHIVYLDGKGANFVKDGQYNSNRNHSITVQAGYGIPDRAMLVGLYEFLDKSLQYVTGDVNRKAPDVFNSVISPLAFISLNENGGVSDVNISSGVYSFNNIDLDDLNAENELAGYSSGENISTSGGSGSGLTVDIEVDTIQNEDGDGMVDRITTVLVNNPGTGYAIGDLITVSGGSAKIRVGEITHGGFNLDKLDGPPEIGITSPADSVTGISNKATDDGNPEFILKLSPSKLKFKLVTDDGGVDIEPISDDGGNNVSAILKSKFIGGSLTSVSIIKSGSGYSAEQRPQLVLDNQHEEVKETVPNDAYRDDLVGEFQGIMKDLPEGDLNASQGDLDAIEDSYEQVPKERDNNQKQPPMEIKLDPDRTRIHQRSQRKLTKSQTDPLKSTIVPEYDLGYLDQVPLPSDYKTVITDDKVRSKKTVIDNIDAITQEKYPEFVEYQESKVQTQVGSFTELPRASQFTKYIMRQYRPDPAESTTITVSLSCTPADIGTSHFTCTTPIAQPNSSTTTANADGSSTTESDVFTMNPVILGPGCQSWEATGEMIIWHSLSRDAELVVKASNAFGNPFLS